MRWAGLLLILLMVSCGGANRERNIQVLDSLKTRVSHLDTGFARLRNDSARLAAMAAEARNRLVVFPKVYQPDTVNVDVLLMIKAYRPFSTYAPEYNMKFQRIKKEIPYTLRQLESLLTDLYNKALKSADADKYTAVETAAATRLVEDFQSLQSEGHRWIRRFDSLAPLVHHLVDSLQSDPANIQAIRLKMLKQKTKRRK